MRNWIEEILIDLDFVKRHTLQPAWFKIVKIFILLGFLSAYILSFDWQHGLVFILVFFSLSTFLHFIYRRKTKRWQQSWLDFEVYEENGERKYKRIGKFYYGAILINALLAILISQIIF